MQMTLPVQNSFARLLYGWLDAASCLLKPSSVSTYYSVADAHLLPEFRDVPLKSVSAPLISDFLRQKSETLSPSTVGTITAVLRHTLQYAEQHDVPLGCGVSSIPHVTAYVRKDAPIFSPSEQTALEASLGMHPDDPSRIGVLLALCTGLRIGELCALRWADIDGQSQSLTVRHTIQRMRNMSPDGGKTVVYMGMPKSASSQRIIPIPARVFCLLEPLRCENACFLLSGTEKPVEPRTMQNRFKTYQREAKVEPANFHALRHTFATRWIEKGFDIKTLSRVLGHSDVATTLNVYVHPSMEFIRGCMDQM